MSSLRVSTWSFAAISHRNVRSPLEIRWRAVTETRVLFPASCRRRICRSCRTARPLDIVSEPTGRTFPYEHRSGSGGPSWDVRQRALGWKIMTPVFDGAQRRRHHANALKRQDCARTVRPSLYDGRTGEPFDNPCYRRLYVLPQAASPGRR